MMSPPAARMSQTPACGQCCRRDPHKDNTKMFKPMQQPRMNFPLKFSKPCRPGSKPRSKPSDLQHQKHTTRPPVGRAAPATTVAPSQHRGQPAGSSCKPKPLVVNARQPGPSSPPAARPNAGWQQPLLFIFEQKKAPVTAAAARTSPAPASAAAWSPVEPNPSFSLEIKTTPQWGQPASPSTQQSPQRGHVQQCASRSPQLLSPCNEAKGPPVTCQPPAAAPEDSLGTVRASISPPCLEIISLKKGFTVKAFPAFSQSRSPAGTASPHKTFPGAAASNRAEAAGVTTGIRASRSAPLPGARWVRKFL
eukprot:XP_027320874.1 proteoglycan 4-like [Anas platyrhynchos]